MSIMKIDKYTQIVLIREMYPRFTDRLLYEKNLDDTVKTYIAYFGDQPQRSKLLANHPLSHRQRELIAFYGTNEHRWKLLREHELSQTALSSIRLYGLKEHIEYIRKNFPDRFK